MLRTDDRVDFPVANSALLLDHRRPLTDVDPTRDDEIKSAASTVPVAPLPASRSQRRANSDGSILLNDRALPQKSAIFNCQKPAIFD